MAELSREEHITYVIRRKDLEPKGQSRTAVCYSSVSAYTTYSEWAEIHGADNVSIELSRTVKTYETISPEELRRLTARI